MNLINELLLKITDLENSWSQLKVVPEDLSSVSKGLTKTELTAALDKVRLALDLADSSGQSVSPIYYQIISSHLNSLDVYIKQHIPSNPMPHIPGLVGVIHNVSNAVDEAFVDPIEDENTDSSFTKKIKSKLAESLSKSEVANRILENTNELVTKNQVASVEISKIVQNSQDATTKIQERDRTTAEATNRISETEKKSVTLVNQLESHLKEVNQSSEEIKQQQNELTTLTKTLSSKLTEAQQLLEDTNRLGLAGAFKTRKESLTIPAIFWIILFLISIGILSYLAYMSNEAVTGDVADWHKLLFRIPLSAPLIWLGWFAIKQYGYTRRIQEDYAFKVASAMSFQGYKNEVAPDPSLVKMLQESAIQNFSANPLRIYEEGKNHGSPMHELFENMTEDKLNKIIELAKALNPKK